jgi:hypothetical protein
MWDRAGRPPPVLLVVRGERADLDAETSVSPRPKETDGELRRVVLLRSAAAVSRPG